MKFHLEPVNDDKISDLCGPTNSILKQIEEELGIKILNRGASFRIKGETSNAQIAKNIILRIYADLEENKTISSNLKAQAKEHTLEVKNLKDNHVLAVNDLTSEIERYINSLNTDNDGFKYSPSRNNLTE